MKKITKLLLMTAIAFGMVACSNDDVPEAPENLKGSTYASISVKLPKGPSTRAALGETWEGDDIIETVDVFLLNETLGTVDHSDFTKASFEGITTEGVLNPTLAVKATPGQNVKAYVILNGNSDVLTILKGATPGDFAGVYETAVIKNASDLASNNGTNDVIMMTNTVKPTAINIQPNITEGEAMTGSANTFFVDVERVVSRAIVTVASPESPATKFTIPVLNAMGTAGSGSIITISDIKYSVGQSNSSFYLIKNTDFTTPTPTLPADYDNTKLATLTKVENAGGAAALDDFKDALLAEKAKSKFVLPVTHDGAANYKKGNTTYFEVTAIFTPDGVTGAGYTAGNDVFLGMKDGKFYTTRELAEAEGQKATHYKGGTGGAIMKYVLWLNPNEIPGAAEAKATMSPTVRNQVYHAHIKGFKQIGLPNNPLNPEDPTDGDNPPSPIKPEDPLQTDDTYLSVQITVLPWGIHSYEINLGNDY